MAILLKDKKDQLNKYNPALQEVSVGTGKHHSFSKWIKGISTKAWIWFTVFILCILGFLILTMVGNKRIEGLQDQRAAARWISEKAASQISIFLTPDVKLEIKDINKLRYTISKQLDEVLNDEETAFEKENNTDDKFSGPFTYAYSAFGTISIVSKDNEDAHAENLNAIGIGGDFFFFHPVDLMGGRYLSSDEMMRDGLVIDTNTAGRLFGSFDVIGKEVIINNKTYYIRGVYRPDSSHFSVGAGADGGYVFMDYQSLTEDGTCSTISSIEVVSKEPVTGYMYNLLKDGTKTGFDESSSIVVKNTGRYSFRSLINVISEWGNRSMQTKSVTFPYWENIARANEDVLALMLIFRILLLMISIIIFIVFLYYEYTHRTWGFHTIKDFFENIVDRHRVKIWKKNKNTQEGDIINRWKDF